MGDLFLVFTNSLVALILCIVVGYICRRSRMLDDKHTSGIADLLVKVAMPCSVFMSLMRPFSTELLVESAITFIAICIIFLLGGVLGGLAGRALGATPGERPVWAFGVAYGNVGFMGIPIISAVFGYEGLFYVAMSLMAFNLLTFTVGVRMFDTKGEHRMGIVKLFLRTPALIGTVAGFGFFLTGLRLPAALEGGVSLIAGMTSPISMILIGAVLAKQRIKDTFTNIRLLPPVALRLMVVPICSWLVLRMFVTNPIMLGVIVTLMAMPPAAATVIFAEQYDGDAVHAAQLVVVGTLICVVTVPLISLLL